VTSDIIEAHGRRPTLIRTRCSRPEPIRALGVESMPRIEEDEPALGAERVQQVKHFLELQGEQAGQFRLSSLYFRESATEGDGGKAAQKHYPRARLRNGDFELEIRTDEGIARQSLYENVRGASGIREFESQSH
jgi:hypothetical protein